MPLNRPVHLLLVASLLLSIAGCGGAGDERDEGGAVTVTFWHSFVASTIPALDELIERFEAEHPDVRIDAQYIPTGDALVQKLVTAVQSNTAPDISWIRSHYMEELVKAEAIYPMAHFMDREDGLTQEELDDIYPALRQYASWQGTLYSLPMEATNLGILYNKEHFREAGLDPQEPPEDWEELRTYAQQLVLDRNEDGRPERAGFVIPAVPATGPQGGYMMWQWIPYIWQAGGYLINEAQTEVLFDDTPGVEALTLWKDLYDVQHLRSFNTQEPLTPFVSGQASMMMDGPWNLPRYPRLMPNTEWAIAMLPAGPEKRATVVAGEYLAIFKQTEHPDAAWKFLKWMIQPETQAFWSMRSGYLPIRESVMELEEYVAYLEENPGHKAFAEQMQYAQAQRPMDFHTLEIQRLLADAIEQSLVGGRDPAEALAEAAEKSNALLATVPDSIRKVIPHIASTDSTGAVN